MFLGLGIRLTQRIGAGGATLPRIVAAMATPAETSAAGALAFTLSVSNSPEGVSWTFALGEGAPSEFELDESDSSQGMVAGLLAYASAPYAVPIVATSDEETPTILNRTINVPIIPLVQAGVTRAVSSMRAQAIEAIWLGAGLPTGSIDELEPGVESPLVDIDAPANLDSVGEITINGPGNATHYIFYPIVSNGEAAIYHAGHGPTIGSDNRQEYIAALIQAGYTTVVLRMPMSGDTGQHDLLDPPDDELNPGEYFWEPPIRIINYLIAQGFPADGIFMSGHSGGGHTVDVVAALDTRVRATASNAGSLPLYIEDTSRDYEQFLPGMADFLDYTDLYVMACDGGREKIHILNDEDNICFNKSQVDGASHEFITRVEAAATAAGGTWALQYEDSPIHQITANARASMLALFARHGAVAPVLTSAVDTADSDITATIGASTTKANGTFYVVATSSATSPSAAQVKAGQDHTGAAADGTASASVTALGAKTAGVTGLTAETSYFGHVMHEDAAGNQSNVVSGGGFTTSSDTVPDAFEVSDWSIAAGSSEADVTINSLPDDGGETITDIEYRLDGSSWVSSGGTSSFTITSLSNNTEYDVELRAVNSVGPGAASDVKSVTPTAGLPSAVTNAHWWFEIDDLSTLKVELTGASAVTPASVDGPVGSIQNKGTLGGWYTMSSDGARPTLRESGGKYWLEGDTSSSHTAAITPTAHTEGSVAVAYQGPGQMRLNPLRYSGDFANGSLSIDCQAGGQTQFCAFTTAGMITANQSHTAPFVAVGIASTTARGLYINGTLAASAGAPNAASGNGDTFRIVWPNKFYGCVINVTTPWGTSDRNDVEDYLASKL